jgi:hypothetical protein
VGRLSGEGGEGAGAVDAAVQALAEFDAAAAAAAADADDDAGVGGGGGRDISDGGAAGAVSSLVTLLLASPACVVSRWRMMCDV